MKTKFFGTPPAMRRTQVLKISNMPLQVKHSGGRGRYGRGVT